MNTVYRPRFGRYLAFTICALCAVSLVVIAVTDGIAAVALSAPWILLIAGAVWAGYWRPKVVVDDAGVHLVNVWRTIDVPWPAIQRIDTKWALTLFTAYGKFTAWAAPAPSTFSTRNLTRSDVAGLPESTYIDQSIRPGDSPKSPSGAAARAVREHWEQLRDAGYLDDPKLEFERVPVTWHWPIIGGSAVLLVLGITSALG